MNFRKLLVAGALSCSLALSSGLTVTNHAFAVQFSDTQGMEAESSINKLVSLGVMRNPGAEFSPDVKLSRTEFAYMANQVVSLNAGKKLTFKDVTAKNAYYTSVLKMVNNGYLTTSKGNVNLSKGVTYSELAKFLAQNLGLKSSYTNRPVDFLFYLVRKDVLDIDTDLDAIVTREDAAVAFDKFITLKKVFTTEKGIVTEVTDKGFTINNGSENITFTNASNLSVFVSGQATESGDIQVGSPATVIANKKGQAAYYAGEFLDAEEGPIKFINNANKWQIGTPTEASELNLNTYLASLPTIKSWDVNWKFTIKMLKDVNLDAFIAPLPNNQNAEFSIVAFKDYQANGAEFAGQAFFTNNDEVTAMYPYIAKVTNKDIAVSGKQVTVTLKDGLQETFNVLDDATITFNNSPATLDKLTGAITATIEADKFGNITTITAVTKK